MKVILIGYPGSQHIVKASAYLTSKYLPGFDIFYLNWMGLKAGWSNFVANYLKNIEDEFVIFALDDYLLTEPINMQVYEYAMEQLKTVPGVVAAKLFECTPEEHADYPVTTQYTIWKRERLIELMNKTEDPWHFEITGSNIFREMGWKSIHLYPALKYNTSSALSGRWSGIRWDGVKEEDINFIKNNNLII